MSDNVKFTIRVPLNLIWEPQEDITAYEVAIALPYIIGQKPIYAEDFDALPFKRHLKQLA